MPRILLMHALTTLLACLVAVGKSHAANPQPAVSEAQLMLDMCWEKSTTKTISNEHNVAVVSQRSDSKEVPVSDAVPAGKKPKRVVIDSSRDGGVWWFPQAKDFRAHQPHQGARFGN